MSFIATTKSLHAFPLQIHPCRYHAESGCLAAAVLELFPLSFFVFMTDGQQSQLLSFNTSVTIACCLTSLLQKCYFISQKVLLHLFSMGVLLCVYSHLYRPAAICMYPARVQILLSHPPLGRKMVMMANRELTASRAQPPEQSTALV